MEKGVVEKLEQALKYLKYVVKSLCRGKNDLAKHNVNKARATIEDAIKDILRAKLDYLKEKLNELESRFRELTMA